MTKIENKIEKDKPKDKVNEEESLKKKEKEHLEDLQRIQAEFENYRKRIDRDKDDFCKFAVKGFIERLIPVLDNFERSLVNKKKENHEEFVKAIEMVHKELWDLLHKEGLKKIEAKEKPFNPELHEPLLQEESDKAENTVLEVLGEGYTLNNKVIRHAKVKISKSRRDKNE